MRRSTLLIVLSCCYSKFDFNIITLFSRVKLKNNNIFFLLGMFMPIGMYLELGGSYSLSNIKCLLSYGVAITLCCVSVLVMVAIAVDRFTSLARPLRYNNLITHSAVERYIAVFWTYSSLVGFSPLLYTFMSEVKIR